MLSSYTQPLLGDRFLLYTDGVTEPENEAGEQFGNNRLEQLMRDNRSRTVSELSQRLMAEIRAWKPLAMTQHDDITLIAIDMLGSPARTTSSAWQALERTLQKQCFQIPTDCER